MIKEPQDEMMPIKNIYEHGIEDPEPSDGMIVVKQLPVIQERLQQVKANVVARVEEAKSLVCTEKTVTAVREERAKLNKELKMWEDKRKAVKKAVLSPYEAFETTFKNCVTDIYKAADIELKGKIDSVESELKQKKQKEVEDYFNEYLAAAVTHNGELISSFISFKNANINVTLSASLKSLKAQAKAFIDRICDDLNLIATQEHKDEILYEYKQSLNVSAAITTVVNRYKAIEEAKVREEALKAEREAAQKATERVEQVIEELAPPTVEEQPETEPQKIYEVSFKVTTSDLDKIKKLKTFMVKEGIEYEQL